MAVVDYFLKIDGVPGESTDHKHRNEIEIESFSWGVSQTGTHALGGVGGTGKASFHDLHFSTPVNSSSPTLMLKCASGQHLKNAVLTARKAGGDGQATEFLKVTFTDVLVSGYADAGQRPPPSGTPGDIINVPFDTVGGPIGGAGPTGTGVPIDNVSLRYAQARESVDATQIGIPPTQAAMLSFDPATNTFKMTDAPGGVFTVGSAGGMVSRAAMEFNNIAILIGLLTAPFSTARLGLGILEIREAAIDPGALNAASLNTSSNTGPQPHLFDVILYTPADGVLTVEDLTRHGTRIGTIRVDPSAPPTSSDIDLTDLVRRRHLDSFGIRIQLRGAPLPGLNREDEHDDSDVDHEGDDRAHAEGDGDDKTRTPGQQFSASFTANLVLDTA